MGSKVKVTETISGEVYRWGQRFAVEYHLVYSCHVFKKSF